MRSVRDRLLEIFPPAEGRDGADVAMADALYCLLRTNEVGVCVDGWVYIRITRESQGDVEALGLMSLLPTGSVPMAVHVSGTPVELAWTVQIGCEDEEWRALSESKRWKNVYLYANGDRTEPGWTWVARYQGTIHRADA
jgi:hypothetical protein